MTDCLVVTTSVPDTACLSITSPMTSIYVWQGEVQEEQEHLLVIKTQTLHYEWVVELLRAEHSYALPEIIATNITHGLPAYLGWIKKSTQE